VALYWKLSDKMAPLHRVIIDTDPGNMRDCPRQTVRTRKGADRSYIGVDDILAMLLAFAASPEEIEVLMLSVTYGNVEVQR
jgi:inosine-uridine nucleoside N-ribohydrolase